MSNENGKVVMFDSPAAAQQRTLTGWVSRDGRFYGDDERLARYAGCTHRQCDSCVNVVEKSRIYCGQCTAKQRAEEYAALPAKQWDGVTPLCTYDDAYYFFSAEELNEYCEDNEIEAETLMLIICDPVKPQPYDSGDLFCDYLADDCEAPDAVVEAIDVLNKAIAEAPPFSWYPGKFRPIFKSEHSAEREK